MHHCAKEGACRSRCFGVVGFTPALEAEAWSGVRRTVISNYVCYFQRVYSNETTVKGIQRIQCESKTMRQSVCSPSHPSSEPGPSQDCSSSCRHRAVASTQLTAVSEPPRPSPSVKLLVTSETGEAKDAGGGAPSDAVCTGCGSEANGPHQGPLHLYTLVGLVLIPHCPRWPFCPVRGESHPLGMLSSSENAKKIPLV